MSIILFGFKSVGKTRFGKILSEKFNRPFVDTDDLVISLYEKEYKKQLPIRSIHQSLGEKKFRELESKAIHLLGATQIAVIALGGGAALDKSNIDHLQNVGQLVYLAIQFDTVQKQILASGIPSFVDEDNPFESLRQIYLERKQIYEAIAAIRLDVDFLIEDQIIKKLSEIMDKKGAS